MTQELNYYLRDDVKIGKRIGEKAQFAFTQLKKSLMQAVTLCRARAGQIYHLWVDASMGTPKVNGMLGWAIT